jgi:SAM-dependent methyltransferase
VLYDSAYYDSIRRTSEDSSGVIVPLVAELIGPRSVLDVGCGDGTWLAAYRRAGVGDCFGVDAGDVRPCLRIPGDRFAAHDLTIPLDLGRRFDLVQSLEVAEHLPSSAAEVLVGSLARHTDTVLFSAAIPHQGGTGHINERWPDYWAGLFRRVGFLTHDWVRPRVWGDDRVAWWYAQNAFLFVRDGAPAEWIKRLPRPTPVGPLLCLVHPKQHLVNVARGALPR